MAGLVPAIHVGQATCVGRLAVHHDDRPDGTLYVGVTSDLARRVWQHREGDVDGFTKRYGLKRLVFVERHDDIRAAIQRETSIKRWSRAWKVNLILAQNPDWDDLYERLPEIV